ncbi:MAG: DUF4412 domain-containing protein [Bacteroidetes bacterium]|nr:DUF4412 domain-containing protein [Bacteroidota bacterium]
MKKFILLILILFYCKEVISQNGYRLEFRGTIGTLDTLHVLEVLILNNNSINKRNFLLERTVTKSAEDFSINVMNVATEPDFRFIFTNDNELAKFPDRIEEYTMNVLGKEFVNGYNSMKIEIRLKKEKETKTFVFWFSDEVANYSNYLLGTVNGLSLHKISNLLKQNKIYGIPVKMVCEFDEKLSYELITAEKFNIDPIIFDINNYSLSTIPLSEYSKNYIYKKIAISKAIKEANFKYYQEK